MKKQTPFREGYILSLKTTLQIMCIVPALLTAGIVQSHAARAYPEEARLSLSISDATVTSSNNIMLFDSPVNLSEDQQNQVTGTVTDENGNPLTGVTILIKGTTIGALTDASGKYSINNVPQNATLMFSFIGMAPQEIPSDGRTPIDVVLKAMAIGLNEVVVVGYGTQKKVNLTGSVSQVSSEVLESRPISNLGQGLQGLIGNLNITNISGTPGRSVSFNIRGITSINGGSPLVLVDGVEMNPNLINPNDVQNVSVLKDAASAAIYGARAAYGVVLITTKSGSRNTKPVINISTDYAIERPTVIPKSLNSMQFVNWMNAAALTSQGSPYFDDEQVQAIQAYYNDPVNNSSLFQHSQDAIGVLRECGNTNWANELFRENYPTRHFNVNVSGGTDKVTYYTSFGIFNQRGLTKPKPEHENYERYNFTQNLSYNVNKWMTLKAKVALNKSDQIMPPGSTSSMGGDMLYTSYSQWPIVPVISPDGKGYDETKGYNTVAYLMEGGYQTRKTQDLWLTGAIKLTPLKGLTINADYTYNVYYSNYVNYRKKYYTRDNGAILLSPWGNINLVNRQNTDNKYIALNTYAEYEKVLGKSSFKVLAGFNQEYGGYEYFSAQRQDLINNDIPYMNLATGVQNANDSKSELAIRGVFSRLNYSFDDRYLIEFNGRYDGSSRFPKNDRFAFFPSMSAGWRISNEAFFQNLKDIINNLKVRASYGSLGNQSVSGYYPYVATYSVGQVNYLFGGNKKMTAYAPGLVSPTLTWETVNQINFGIDFAILKEKLSGSFDIYTRTTEGMLAKSTTLPSVLATSEPQTNAADLKTNGFEFTLSWRDALANGFNYGINLMLADYSSEITKYSNPQGIISNYYEGMKFGEIWGFETEGLFQSDEEAALLDQSEISGHEFLAGDIKFKDLTGDGKISRGAGTLEDHGDMKVIGNSTPRYSYGLRADAEWKGFDFAIFFQGVGKRSIEENSIYFLQHYSSEWAVAQPINMDYWTPDNTDAYFPRPRMGNADEVFETQSRFLQNAAYIRLKQLTLGYSLPKSLIDRVNISNIRIYFSSNNLWTHSKMLEIFDPEISSTNTYPLTRSVAFGIDITF